MKFWTLLLLLTIDVTAIASARLVTANGREYTYYPPHLMIDNQTRYKYLCEPGEPKCTKLWINSEGSFYMRKNGRIIPLVNRDVQRIILSQPEYSNGGNTQYRQKAVRYFQKNHSDLIAGWNDVGQTPAAAAVEATIWPGKQAAATPRRDPDLIPLPIGTPKSDNADATSPVRRLAVEASAAATH